MLEPFFNEFASVQVWNFIKKRLQLKFVKFLRTLFLTEYLEGISEELFKKEVRNFPYLYHKGNKTKKIGKRTHYWGSLNTILLEIWDSGFRIQFSRFKKKSMKMHFKKKSTRF